MVKPRPPLLNEPGFALPPHVLFLTGFLRRGDIDIVLCGKYQIVRGNEG